MKKSLILSVVLAGLVLSASTFGTEVEPKRVGLTIRAGAFVPVAQSVRVATTKVWPNVGIEYEFANSIGKKGADQSVGYSLSVDYAGSTSNRGIQYLIGNTYHVPVLANVVYRTNGVVLSAGVGARVTNINYRDNIGLGFRAKGSRINFAYQASVGYEFNRKKTPFGVEARYLGSALNGGNGICANAFVRF